MDLNEVNYKAGASDAHVVTIIQEWEHTAISPKMKAQSTKS